MNKYILVLTALLILIPPQLYATAIIAIIYPNRIILSVDSRLTYTNPKTGQKTYGKGNKLTSVNGYAFAFAGYRGYTNDKNFKPEIFIKDILSKPGKITSQAHFEVATDMGVRWLGQQRLLSFKPLRSLCSF